MSNLATRVNALKPTAAEIGDVDAIMRRYAELEAKKRASYVVRKPVEKPVQEVKIIEVKPRPSHLPRLPHKLDQATYTCPIQGPCLPTHPQFRLYRGERDILDVATPVAHVRRKSVKEIIAEVAEKFDVSVIEILSRRRNSKVVIPRHFAMWRCRNETELSYPAIGRLFKRDHTVPMYACEKIDRLIAEGKLDV